MFAGIWGFLTQLTLVKPRARHCMFLLGILWSFFCGALSFGLMIHSIDAARKADKVRRDSQPTSTTRSFVEAEFHVSPFNTISPPAGEDTVVTELRCGAALAYATLGYLFLATFLLNCHNLRRLMKHGQTFFPRFQYPWMSRHWSTYSPARRSRSNSLIKVRNHSTAVSLALTNINYETETSLQKFQKLNFFSSGFSKSWDPNRQTWFVVVIVKSAKLGLIKSRLVLHVQ